MADCNLFKNVSALDVSPQFSDYSKVIIHTRLKDVDDNEIVYEAGDDTGRTLEMENPWANETIAAAVLERVRGWAYQPYDARNALLNPAAELGDSVDIDDTFGGIYQQTIRFSSLYNADISAPWDEEIDHEYAYQPASERRYTRQIDAVKASLLFYADRIDAKVEKTNDNTEFGWELTSDSWDVHNQSGTIFRVDENGAEVSGTIKASDGLIGGFNIGANGIYNNISSFGETGKSSGVYVGINGIQLGENFKVDSSGNVRASSMVITGTLNVGGNNISASNLYTGAYQSAVNYGSWSNTSYGWSNATIRTGVAPEYFHATAISGDSDLIAKNDLYVGGWSDSTHAYWKRIDYLANVTFEASRKGTVALVGGGSTSLYTYSLTKSWGSIHFLGNDY